ncbi:hypothetical protein TsFJ059_004229 [Trichoderma semiorbis]|uniref:Vegetative cell wall protein gp1 n=1 Tax=Trichoderma semiorbis TaxID=1491008 RepID=A0A9P8KWV0_9HYPO|nr:hypothetical protein TsFJ059_004229 [Trichoderma semiorbis]
MNYPSPRTPGSTPIHEWEYTRMSSATPTPSPRPSWLETTPRRPATRAAHSRASSYSQAGASTPRAPVDSPRYNSSGQYATVDGTAAYYADYSRDAYDSPQSHIPPTHVRPPTSHGHARRSSAANVPQRPSTVRPSTQAYRAKAAAAATTTPKATEADARKHRIPTGYSLKNWDPSEEPILLLGSVFDANSLGKWIYDWTVYRAGANSPIADMAGELWLLLIQLSGKVKRAEDIVGRVRSTENREIMTDFIDAGERLTEKLRGLLKACEAPMLKAAKKKQSGLGKNSGVEFVDTLFGRDRELAKTEKFMQSVRLFSLRFDANCEGILQNPSS